MRTVGVDWLPRSHGKPFIRTPDYRYSSVSRFLMDLRPASLENER
ncbi:hypothetical protein ACF3MZ_10225 [Paenibacillaceae bacterium WGS1546]